MMSRYNYLKFRAWDKKDKIMRLLDWLIIDHDKEGNWIEVFDLNHRKWANNDYELMQFTGLLDKNGKEIYEGDIVRLDVSVHEDGDDTDDTYTHTDVGAIRFDDGAYWFEGKWLSENCHFHYNDEDREIIGNIYENPELLEVRHGKI